MKLKITFLFFILVGILYAQPKYYLLKNYANDFTGTLSEYELYSINQQLKLFDDSTSNQIVLLVINSLNGYPIEMYAQELAEKNGIGSKKNNGVLLLIALDDKKIRIEVGYGLEGALTDALANSIIRNEIVPYFRDGDFYHGIVAGLNSIMKAAEGEYKEKKKGNEEGEKFPFWIIVLIFIILSMLGRGRGGGLGSILLWGALSGSSRSGGFGGVGFGGGSFGGFSGGGGSFGGGGSSGSW